MRRRGVGNPAAEYTRITTHPEVSAASRRDDEAVVASIGGRGVNKLEHPFGAGDGGKGRPLQQVGGGLEFSSSGACQTADLQNDQAVEVLNTGSVAAKEERHGRNAQDAGESPAQRSVRAAARKANSYQSIDLRLCSSAA